MTSLLHTEAETDLSRLDRRVLGAGTTLRFVLLVVLVTASCLQLTWFMARGLRATTRDPRGCLGDRSEAAYQACLNSVTYPSSWAWSIGGTLLVFVLALIGYVWLPRWKVRGGRLVAIRDAELIEELGQLTRQAGLDRSPAFVMDPVAATPSAVVFGRWRSHTVSLHGGLIARRAADPDGFRTVVLHELAHIRNRDVDIAYATEALWRSFALVVLLPWVVMNIYPPMASPSELLEQLPSRWLIGLRSLVYPLVLAALVMLARADVLRTRELYADLDAVRWGGSPQALAVGGAAPVTAGFGLRNVGRRFISLWRTHPAWTERQQSLLDPAALFGIRATTMVLTAAAVVESAQVMILELDLPVPRSADTVSAWLAAALITGIVGTALWRAVTHALLAGRPTPSGLRAGVWLGLGLAAGELVFRSGSDWLPSHPHVLLLLIAGCAGLTWWAVQCTEVWIRTCRGRSLRWVQLGGLAVTLAVFGSWFVWWHTEGHLYLQDPNMSGLFTRLQDHFPYSGTPGQLRALREFSPVFGLVLMMEPAFMVGGVLLWLYPLTAWIRRPATGVPAWVRRALPDTVRPPAVPTAPPPLGWVLKRGAVGGALAVCAVAAIRAWLHLQPVTWEERGTTARNMFVLLWIAVGLCAAAAVTAIVVCAQAPRCQLPAALVAAGCALLLGLAGAFALGATDGCVPQMAVQSACDWQPAQYWPLLRFLAAFSLSVGFFAVTIVAPLGVAIQAVRHRRGRGSTARPDVAKHTDRPASRPLGTGPVLGLVAGGGTLGILAVLAARVWLHTQRPADWYSSRLWLQWFQSSQASIALALVLAVVLATAAASRTAGRGHPGRVRTLIVTGVAGATLAAGAAAAFVLTTTDGCTPPLAVLTDTCDWRPAKSWQVLQYLVAPSAVALGACAVGAGTVLTAAWRWRRGRGPGVKPPDQLAAAGRIWWHRTYLALTCITVLALFSGWWQQMAQTSEEFAAAFPQSQKRDPGPSPGEPGSGTTVRQRLIVWQMNGGQAMQRDFAAVVRATGSALTNGSRNGRLNPDALLLVCDHWVVSGRRALAVTPIPESSAQKHWRRAAALAVKGGAECHQAVENDDASLLWRSVHTLRSARYELDEVNLRFRRFGIRVDHHGPSEPAR
ncbi:M48 family metallopeptidase [Streptomyces sp. WAC01526]|uniref:M48 family metallopeptidase n=1 Tax=Streptomyces sp. WAC01526 TaxID=2588709 RepID=UPI0011E0665D|nr:M48 family metalloprotease [Streptomyces sp. WAC01526]